MFREQPGLASNVSLSRYFAMSTHAFRSGRLNICGKFDLELLAYALYRNVECLEHRGSILIRILHQNRKKKHNETKGV